MSYSLFKKQQLFLKKRKKFKKEEGLIDWNRSAEEIHNQARAMASFQGAYTFYQGKMIKIIKTLKTGRMAENASAGGIVSVTKQGIEVNTGSGVLLITEVKPENRSVMSAAAFANGARLVIGGVFG